MDGNDQPPTSLKRRGPQVAVILVIVALLIAGAVTWFVLDRPHGLAAPDAGAVAVIDAGAPEPEHVDIAAGETLVKGLVPDSWLEGGDSIRRAAAAVYAVAEGQSPRVMVPFLDPGGELVVDEVKPPKKKKKEKEKSKFFISEKNDARYDTVTAAFTKIDAAAVGRLYGAVRPYLDAAFREIAPPGKTFDAAFTAAVDRLAAVPVADGPREVVPLDKGVGYAWADPKLEALKPAEKHLLRMGPKNARAVVAQLKAFRAAMSHEK